MSDRPPGMHDVARQVGVSHQTVSRVVNGHPNVRPETRERVMAAIAELGYRRNTAARALVTRRSGIVGVVSTGSGLFGPASTLMAVESAARDAGYFVSVSSLADASGVAVNLEHFLDQGAEGVVVIAPWDEVAEAAVAFAAQLPVVLVAADAPVVPGFHSLSVDQEAGARMAVAHLLDLGHRSILHVAGPAHWFDARARVRGYRQELLDAGITPREVVAGDWSAESGYAIGRTLKRSSLPDAVFLGNDMMALGFLRAMRERKIAVPRDISVVGFDDVLGSAFFDPPLTTIRQDFARLGQECLAVLGRVLGGSADPDSAPIPPELVCRHSTGPARKR